MIDSGDCLDPRGIIVFTLHKSASMFIHQICAYLCRQAKIPYHSPNNRGNHLDAHTLLTDKDFWYSLHGCFAPVRFYVDIPNLDTYRVILHLRDPRDVLVSMYFSYCFIHVGEVAANTGYRKKVADKGIDWFVLEMAINDSMKLQGDYGTGNQVSSLTGGILRRYSDYIEHLLGRDNVTLVCYEEMVTSFRSWLEKFLASFPINNREVVLESIASRSGEFFPSRPTDVMEHMRHIKPGDHRDKLKPSTIDKLNYYFSDVLDALGYDRS